MAIGNVIGSNIFNVFMILGITALIAPLTITKSNAKRDIPLNIGVTALLILLGLKNTIFGIGSDVISRWEGALLLGIFIVYLWRSFASGAATEEESDEESRSYSTGMSILMILGGLGALVGGGRLFVNSATAIAEQLHMSEKLIAITIMSAGTSLPELATCIVAARKGKGQMALGNIIGSNISNILLILGGAALIHPMSFAGISMVDTAVVSASAILLLVSVFSFRKGYIDRAEGAFFVLIQISYMIWLIING